MQASAAAQSAPSDRQWFIVGRWQEYAGEGRANLLRIVAIGAFYIVQLVNYQFFVEHTEKVETFHQAATALAVAWTMVALGVLLCLRRQVFPPAVKFISTGCDLVLLTGLAIVGGGPASPLVFVYFLIIALAALRFQLRLVWFATLGAMLGYVALLARFDEGQWFDAEHPVPVAEELVVLLSLALVGIMLGQVIRRAGALADDYARRLASIEKGSP